MTPEERKEYDKKYYEANKEKIKEDKKEYYKENKEQKKEYRKENKEHIAKRDKEYKQTDAGIKSRRVSHWVASGLICDDFDSLYEYYINCKFCEVCAVELVEGVYGANKRCLDHSHKTGLFRNVLCCSCNNKRGENNI